jgi:hypothetical protein
MQHKPGSHHHEKAVGRVVQSARRRYMMSFGAGFTLIAIGAALTFALTGSVRGIDLHTVGIILMVAGAALLLLALWIRAWRQDLIGRGRGEPWN